MLNFNLKIRNDRYKWWHGYLGWQWQRRSLKPIVAQLDLLIQVSSHCGCKNQPKRSLWQSTTYILQILYISTTYLSVNALRSKMLPRDHHGNLQLYISTTIAYIYTLSKCQRTKRHPKDHHNDGWSMIIRSSSRWQSNINLVVSGRLLEVWVCCYFCPFLTSFNQVSLKITKTIVNAEGICPRNPRNRI